MQQAIVSAASILAFLCMAGVSSGAEVAAEVYNPAGAPSAHNPRYDDRTVWPESVTETAYYKQTWEPARLLVWAGRQGPAEGGVVIKGDELNEPANWLEFPPADGGGYGAPHPASSPPDANTDVVFPDQKGGRGYNRGMQFDRSAAVSCRHLTVGFHVSLDIGSISGNLWADRRPNCSRFPAW